MEFEIEILARVFEEFILPPGSILVLLVLGILLLKSRPRGGRFILCLACLVIYLLSAPYFAAMIADQVETYPPLESVEQIDLKAGAIVVLAGGRTENADEYSGETVNMHTMTRLRYAAILQRKTGLPILVSGGIPGEISGMTLAQLMDRVLREELNSAEVWLEDRSRTTAENAYFSRAVLAEKNIDRIFLVTQAWHMPRAVFIFEKAGLDVIPAPTASTGQVPLKFDTVLPSASGLLISRQSIREIGSMLWYRILH